MRKKSILVAIMAIALLITQQAWALEMEEAGVVFPGEEDYPDSTQPGWGNNGRLSSQEGQRLFLHGYGELHYNAPEAGDAQLDLHRMVFGLSYIINDSITLHTEVDFEHAAQEMELEFAYLDFMFNPAFNARAGLMLMPVGPLNEFHEPPLFYSVERPAIQKVLIPTTWQEGGFGIFGTPMDGLSYRLYVVGGLAGDRFDGKNGVRKGRSKADGDNGHPKAGEKLAVVGRLEYYAFPGLDLGLSLYQGGVDQKNNMGGNPSVGIYELDGRVRMNGFDFRAVYVKIDVDDADKINAAHVKSDNSTADPLTGNKSVGDEMVGWYAEIAYNMDNIMGTNWNLVPFVRFSEYNTQDSVPTGFSADPKNDKEVTTYGIAYYPDPQIAIKADLQNTQDAAGGDRDQFNLGLTWMY